MAEVKFDNVTKVYANGVLALKAFTIGIQDAEFVVIVGPSGCGKSTTLRMLAGLEEVTEGLIAIDGRVINDVPPKDRDIAMVFQNYALYPHMSVRQNLAFALKLRRTPKAEIERRVRDAARILGIEELLDRSPKVLSGGQRQRVAVGRAIVRHPKAFLFDEPLSNLDARLRIDMRAELKRLHQRLRTTTLYVTHDQEEAMTLGDRIVVLKDGVMQQCGTPLEIYGRPANRFVAGFVGTPPMNFLNGRLVADGALFFDEGSVRLRLTPAGAQRLADKVGGPAVLGIRPEAMSLRPEGRFAGADNRLPVRVSVVEPLGEKMDLFCATSVHPHVVARVDAAPDLRAGADLTLHVDMAKTHVFEPGDDGRNWSL
jgi:multiple sugar transport system ATP-binding protein